MNDKIDVLAWRIVGPVAGSGSGWIDAKERQPPSAYEVHANGCRLDLLTGSAAAVAELVEAARQIVSVGFRCEYDDELAAINKLADALAKLGGAK